MVSDNIKKCPECGSSNLYNNKDKGEIICRSCGLVIDSKNISLGKEWRDFEEGDDSEMKRSGAPTSYTKYDLGMGTAIGSESDAFSLDKVSMSIENGTLLPNEHGTGWGLSPG